MFVCRLLTLLALYTPTLLAQPGEVCPATLDSSNCGCELVHDAKLVDDMNCDNHVGSEVAIFVRGVNNVTLDLNGYTLADKSITGASLDGVFVEGATDFTLQNGQIAGFSFGVVLSPSSLSGVNNVLVSNVLFKENEVGVSGIGAIENSVVEESTFIANKVSGVVLGGNKFLQLEARGNIVRRNSFWYTNACDEDFLADGFSVSLLEFANETVLEANCFEENVNDIYIAETASDTKVLGIPVSFAIEEVISGSGEELVGTYVGAKCKPDIEDPCKRTNGSKEDTKGGSEKSLRKEKRVHEMLEDMGFL